MNILVVEDERNLADALVHILKGDGWNAEAAYDGPTGLAYAQSGMYDAAILDVMLPGMDGFELLRSLRRSGSDMPVMMLTARDQTQDKVAGLDGGADDYMTPGRIVSKRDLICRVWGTDAETSDNSAEAYVSFLRKKLAHLHSKTQITTLRMLGYRLEQMG